MRNVASFLVVLSVLLVGSARLVADEEENKNKGQAKLDQAIDAKLSAENVTQLSEVIKLAQEAIEEGLDEDNLQFAKQLLTSALIQRGSAYSEALFRGDPDAVRSGRQLRQLRALALGDLEDALEQDSNQPQALAMVGRLEAIPGGNKERALEALNKCLELEKEDRGLIAKALIVRATLWDDVDKQIADFNEAVKAAPDEVEVIRGRGMFLAEQKRYDEAEADLKKAAELEPDDVMNQIALGSLLAERQKYPEALPYLDKAIELEPQSPQLYLQRARVRLLAGKTADALPDLDKMLELVPDQPMALLLRANAYHQLGKRDEAMADVEQVLRQRGNFAPALRMRGMLLADSGKMKEATSALRQAVDLDPEDTELKLQLALVELAGRDPAAAVNDFTDIIKEDGDNFVALQGRADAYLAQGKHEDAFKDYEAALKLEPNSTTILNNLAWMLATSPDDKLRDGKRSVELATKACELTEFKQAHILSTLAAGYAEQGDWDKAIEWSTKAVDGGDPRLKPQLEKELKSYHDKKPWRELIAEPLAEAPAGEQAKDTAQAPQGDSAPDKAGEDVKLPDPNAGKPDNASSDDNEPQSPER